MTTTTTATPATTANINRLAGLLTDLHAISDTDDRAHLDIAIGHLNDPAFTATLPDHVVLFLIDGYTDALANHPNA